MHVEIAIIAVAIEKQKGYSWHWMMQDMWQIIDVVICRKCAENAQINLVKQHMYVRKPGFSNEDTSQDCDPN